MNNLIKILIIDDDIKVVESLTLGLGYYKFDIKTVQSGREGLDKALTFIPDVIILDLGLPDIDGLDFILRIRKWSATPVIVLSGRTSEQDKILAFNYGADDFIVKPFHLGELIARIQAAIRHSKPNHESQVFKTENLIIDFESRVVIAHGNKIKLTSTQFSILELFVNNPGKVLKYDYIIEKVWGVEFSGDLNSLRVQVNSIRKLIGEKTSEPKLILTESRIGYMFNIPI